jgi:hypothetical protein
LIDWRRHSSVSDVRSFRAAAYDTDHYLVAAKVREILAVSKQTSHRFNVERFNRKKLIYSKVSIMLKSQIGSHFENSDPLVDFNSACKTVRVNNTISA